jgi:hypothetical protein
VAEVRAAEPGDVSAIHRFGEAHVGAHYAPLIGTCTPSSAANAQAGALTAETVGPLR